ncbi:capsule biosynthesis protein [Kordiimonas sp.]|uniref:capsule biosynthesis protein n=1 Tax=Kordiimonas sp. TaxID=1970157 RepID=UPI003A94A5AA
MVDEPSSAQTHTATPHPRAILFLQGLATPFFATLAHILAEQDHQIHRVHFCGGDQLFSGPAHKNIHHHAYQGTPDGLPAFYQALLSGKHIDTVLLFGDCRPVHTHMRSLAEAHGAKLYVFEEGYIRPGWVTMEAGGTNGFSRMPHSMKGIATLFEDAPHKSRCTLPAVATDMRRRALMDIAAHGANMLHKFRFPHYRTHRPATLGEEAVGWIKRGWSTLRHGGENKRTIKRFELGDEPYFLAPLQLNSDYQIREHSRFSGMVEFIEETLTSFAHHAPKDSALFFKNHPLDNGMINYRGIISRMAAQLGIAARVGFAAGGNLDLLLRKTRGVVLVNSTVGFKALSLYRPMKVLGRAVYDIEGLTDPQPLDSFWQKPLLPQQRLADEFLTVVENYTQVRGDLFSKAGIALAAQEAARVITGEKPRLPQN